MDTVNFNIAKQFSRTPGPRYIKEGFNSGELLRTTQFYDLFRHAIDNDIKVTVNLDGTFGYGTSFLEEIFGGLIRIHNLRYEDIIKHLEIVSEEEPYLIDDILAYLKDAREQKEAPIN